MEKALNPAPGAERVVWWGDGVIVGAASYRDTPEGTKLINIGVTWPGRGIGRILFEIVKEKSDGRVWCKALPQAEGFYLKMGMTPGESLPDGRRIYRLG